MTDPVFIKWCLHNDIGIDPAGQIEAAWVLLLKPPDSKQTVLELAFGAKRVVNEMRDLDTEQPGLESWSDNWDESA